jgi:hypothetical protein
MGSQSKSVVLVEIRLPVDSEVLIAIGTAMGEAFPGCVMRQEGSFLIVERAVCDGNHEEGLG